MKEELRNNFFLNNKMKISNINDTLTVQKTLIINQGGNQGGTSTSDLTMNPIYYLEYPINTFTANAINSPPQSGGFLEVSMSASGQYQTAVGSDSDDYAIIYNSTDFGNTFTANAINSTSQSGYFLGVSISANGQYQTAVGYDDDSNNSFIYNSVNSIGVLSV
jgi:hypothetical protein